MAEARKMSKTELFAHFVEHFAAVTSASSAPTRGSSSKSCSGCPSNSFRIAASSRCPASRSSSYRSAKRGPVATQQPGKPSKSRPSRWSRLASRSSSRTPCSPKRKRFRPDNRREWSTGPARLPCCSRPGRSSPVNAGWQVRRGIRDGERNRHDPAPARWPAARCSCRSGKPAAVSVTTKAKSTVDGGLGPSQG